MTFGRLLRGEIRKLTTTKLLLGFLAVLVVIAALDAAVVAFGTDMDGSQAFLATAADQQPLMAFAFNAMIGTSLFGAIAVAREYGHHTVVPMFLTSPRRVITGVAIALPSTGYGFMVGAGGLAQLLAAATLAGAIGAVLGAGLGTIIRNVGGAVTTAVLVLFVLPPLVVQLFSDAAPWIPTSLFAVISGVSTDVDMWAALLSVTTWAVIPAALGPVAVQRRDVV